VFWEKARIPEELVYKWEALKKNKARRTATQVANEQALTETLMTFLMLHIRMHYRLS